MLPPELNTSHMKSEFEAAFNEIAETRALTRDMVIEALQQALVSAYQRESGIGKAQRVEAFVDPKTWRPTIFVEKEVVEEVQDKRTEVDLERARYYHPEAQIGDMVMVRVEGTLKHLGRIAAQTAKQVILQKIREAERKSLYEKFIQKEGELVTGTVQSVNSQMVTVALDGAEGILPRDHQIPGERYKQHEKIQVYIVEVKQQNRGPQIKLSRTHKNMLMRLLELEVPEIYNGYVEIKSIAREAGYRSKVAVAALQDGIDPVGACVGQKGVRIQNIVRELHDEKIDVIEWSPNPENFIAKALSPARVSGVYLEDDPFVGRTALVIVPEEMLSLAIGKEGQNARLAAKLTGWRIDIKSVIEAVTEAIANLNTPELRDLQQSQAEMIAEVKRILEKRAANRVVTAEEYALLSRFSDMVQRRLMAARQQARQQRLAEIEAVKATLPAAAFRTPVSALPLPSDVLEALQPMGNVGEIMWRYLLDEKRLHQLLSDCPPDSFRKLQEALDTIVFSELPEAEPQPAPEPAAAEAVEAASANASANMPAAFPDLLDSQLVETPARRAPAAVKAGRGADEDFEDDELPEIPAGGKNKGKKKKKRQLIYDEERGGMIVRRQRKRGSGWDDWDE
jgi:N utilization substance protein A